MKNKKKIKIVIIILAVLLALSLSALGGTILYNKLSTGTSATVTVPDNMITPHEDTTKSDSSNTDSQTDADESSVSDESSNSDETSNGDTPANAANSGTDDSSTTSAPSQTTKSSAEAKKAATIELYNKQPEENTAFKVDNMFPGDTITKYYRVRVSYHDKVTVHYKADVRPGFEKLSEVLNVRIKLLNTGETMYDGLMRDMPESVTYKLTSQNSATDELYYEITAYLDTSVGNDYQNKNLIADFKWWVEETGNLNKSPQTGYASDITLWAVLAASSGCALILLMFVRRRKEGKENG